jgi:hypothetical protein
MKKSSLLVALVLYLVSAAASYALFTTMNGALVSPTGLITQTPTDSEIEAEPEVLSTLLEIDPNAPKDQVCPLNGRMYTEAEREAWETRRPLAVMIENSPDARPQSGLSMADVVYEAVAEGGVTRFMGLFYCASQAFDVTIAPIRSARTYFVDYASGYNYPLYVNVGGANLDGPSNALGQIASYGWNMQNNLSQFTIGFPTFVRNETRVGRPVATEHTMESTTEKLWAVAEKRGWTNMSKEIRLGRTVIPVSDWKDGFESWTFADQLPSTGGAQTVSYDFWSGHGMYSVVWNYNSENGSYDREMGGAPHTDLNNFRQISAANVVLILTDERGPINELKHLLYRTTGTGEALIFQNGSVIKARWSKPNRESELKVVDARGQDIPMARGFTWISVLDKSFNVEYN